MVNNQEKDWASLRDNIKLIDDGNSLSSYKHYKLYDTASNEFYQIGLIELEILKRWHLSNQDLIVLSINDETCYNITNYNVEALYQFLDANNLLCKQGSAVAENFIQKHQIQKKEHFLSALTKKYLFFRIPLFTPDKQITYLYNKLKQFISYKTLCFIIGVTLIGVIGILSEWEYYTQYFYNLISPKGTVYALISLFIAKIMHELAHALTTKHFGCKIYNMGVAFIVLFPMLWTDTSDSWRLKKDSQRMAIALAGVGTELALAGLASFLWVILPEGELKTMMLAFSGVTWIGTIAVNFNPLMKFDGYYAFSDFLKIPNLQSRSLSHIKGILRHALFGWNNKIQDHVSSSVKRIFCIYGFCCLIYRIFLFTGIAIIVYHALPSPFGIIMGGIEVFWFLIYPVINEIKIAILNKAEWFPNKRFSKNIKIAVIISILMVFPINNNINGFGVYRSSDEVLMSNLYNVQIKEVFFKNGDKVKKGDKVYEMHSPILENKHQQLNIKLNQLTNEYNQYVANNSTRNKAFIVQREISSVSANIQNIAQQMHSLNIISPVNGEIHDIPDGIKKDTWLNSNEFLGFLISDTSYVEAFISEFDIDNINIGDKAKFYPSKDGISPIYLKVAKIEKTRVKEMPYRELLFNYGGGVIFKEKDQTKALSSYYRVLLSATTTDNKKLHYLPGDVVISGKYSNIINHMIVKLYSLLVREFSFI